MDKKVQHIGTASKFRFETAPLDVNTEAHFKIFSLKPVSKISCF
jgi:hypothetical protein